ncbi:N-acetyltransferase [Actinomycetes bacterium]|jgi:phosphinothricin acetyltransferase|nr:N-acetyltransferase [Actinomycetes bacterium]
MSTLTIREATSDDAQAIRTIYNHEVENETSTMDLVPRTLEVQQEWIAARSGAFCAVVAVDSAGAVLGFGALSEYKDRTGYRTTVENSVYVRRDVARRGIGRQILNHLLAVATVSGFHSVIARIESTSTASRDLHSACGYKLVGVEQQVARKFGKWLDIAVMQCILQDLPQLK